MRQLVSLHGFLLPWWRDSRTRQKNSYRASSNPPPLLPKKIFTWSYLLIFWAPPSPPITGVAKPSSHSWPPRACPGLSYLEKLECTVITAMTKAAGCTVDLDGIIMVALWDSRCF